MNTKSNSLFAFIKKAEIEVPFTYSGIMRFLRKHNPEKINDFMVCFQKAFTQASLEEEDCSVLEKICLMETLQKVEIEK